MTTSKNGLAQLHSSVLTTELASLRTGIDGLSARFRNEYGGNTDVAQRAEQLSAAIQRLEWALSRLQLRSLSKAAGA